MIGLLLALAAAASPADAATGRWRTEDRDGIIEIARCGPSLCGRLVASEGLRANPNLRDDKNRDPALRGRLLKNMLLLSQFMWDGTSWSNGLVYNPQDGRNYTARVTNDGPDRLKLRGCVFVPFCKTQTWTRAR